MSSIAFVSLRRGNLGHAASHAELRDVATSCGLEPDDFVHLVIDSVDVHVDDLLRDVDAVIVGGSSLNISDDPWYEWQRHVHQQLDKIVASGLPTLLICFGTSWLTHRLGATISDHYSEASGPTFVELSDAARTDPLASVLPRSFTALTGHTEATFDLGPAADELTVLASGPTCPVQLVRYGDRVWGCQFHAEMNPKAMKLRMDFYYDYGYFAPEDYDDIVRGLPSVDTTYANMLVKSFVELSQAGRLAA